MMFVYKAQEKRKKKLTGDILVKTNSPSLPPSLPPPQPFSHFVGSNDKKNSQVLLFVEGVKQKKFISLWSATKKCSSLKNEKQKI